MNFCVFMKLGRFPEFELGSGDATVYLAEALSTQDHTNIKVVGVDTDLESIPQATSANLSSESKNAISKNVSFMTGDAHALSFESASFDAVLCQQGLQHFTSPTECLRNIAKVTKPFGNSDLVFVCLFLCIAMTFLV